MTKIPLSPIVEEKDEPQYLGMEHNDPEKRPEEETVVVFEETECPRDRCRTSSSFFVQLRDVPSLEWSRDESVVCCRAL